MWQPALVSTPPTTTAPEPLGWRMALLVPAVLAGLSMIGPFSVDTAFPAFREMEQHFSVSPAEMQWVVGAYMLSFAVMSPIHGPLSDAVGRKPVMLLGVAIYVLASIGCALSTSLSMLLTFRVLQGLSAGGGVIISRTLIRDIYEGAQAQRLMSRMVVIFGVAPAVAPMVGGWLLQAGSWRGIFWFLVAIGASLLIATVLVLPETHPPERRIPLRPGALLQSLLTPARSLAFHRVAWASALNFGGQFLYIGGAALFVVDLLGRGELDFWMMFAPMVAGIMLGGLISSRTAGIIAGPTLVTHALTTSVVGALLGVVVALTPMADELPWAVISLAILAVGSGAAMPVFQLLLLDLFPQTRGGAVSLFTFLTLALNGLTSALLVPLVMRSMLVLTSTVALMVLAGAALWWLHLRAERRGAERRG